MRRRVCGSEQVVTVKSTPGGNVDFDDLQAKIEKHKDNLNSFMVRIVLRRVVDMAVCMMLTANNRGAHPTDYLPQHIRCVRGACARVH